MLTLVKSGLGDVGLSQLIRNDKKVGLFQQPKEEVKDTYSDAAQVNISREARHLQRLGVLAQQGDELRAEKVSRIKEQIRRGEYHVDAVEVATAIVRSDISWLLGGI